MSTNDLPALPEPTLAEVADFLDGTMPLDGVWFGDPHPALRGAFWWRKHLKAAVAQRDEQIAALRDTNAELLEALRLAQQIIGHPDDAISQHIASVVAKATEAA